MSTSLFKEKVLYLKIMYQDHRIKQDVKNYTFKKHWNVVLKLWVWWSNLNTCHWLCQSNWPNGNPLRLIKKWHPGTYSTWAKGRWWRKATACPVTRSLHVTCLWLRGVQWDIRECFGIEARHTERCVRGPATSLFNETCCECSAVNPKATGLIEM